MNKFSLYFALLLFIFIVSCTLLAYWNKDNDATYLEVSRVVYVTNEITVIVPVTLPDNFSTTPVITTFPYTTQIIAYTTDYDPPATQPAFVSGAAAVPRVTAKTSPPQTAHTYPSATHKTEPAGKININTAALEQLTAIPYIGEVHAQNIIDYRKQHGKFNKITDLLEVDGIGEKTFEKIKDYVKV